MIEPVDQTYIEDRAAIFGKAGGNLWKCRNGASLQPITASVTCGPDEGKGESYSYTLLTNKKSPRPALAQLSDFTNKIKTLKNEEFHKWITEVCDVELLLRTYAVSTAVGMWDDYWNRGTNYYLYFNSTDQEKYEVFFIPFDYEMSLGNGRSAVMSDPGRQDPYNWGKTANTLMVRLMQNPEFKAIYREALLELTLPEAFLLDYEISSAIVNDFMYQASFHSSNDTGINLGTKDMTAPWSTHQEYRIAAPDDNNFFKIRAEAIRNYSE
jgi:spore coat protein CotH